METKNKTGKGQVETYQVTSEAPKDKVKCKESKISLKKRGQSLHLKVSNSNIHEKELQNWYTILYATLISLSKMS